MLTVYRNDIEGFDKDDWGDMLDNPRVPVEMKSARESWDDGMQAAFEVCGFDPMFHGAEWESFPVKEFTLDLEHDGEKIVYSGELKRLLGDIIGLREAKRRARGLLFFDRDVDAEMDSVLDSFLGAHDRALARALRMLLKELHAARGERDE